MELAEGIAILQGSRVSSLIGVADYQVIVESNCAESISKLLGQALTFWTNSSHSFRIQKVHRNPIEVAHGLARFCREVWSDGVLQEAVPTCVSELTLCGSNDLAITKLL